jgi:hypothetical protein
MVGCFITFDENRCSARAKLSQHPSKVGLNFFSGTLTLLSQANNSGEKPNLRCDENTFRP